MLYKYYSHSPVTDRHTKPNPIHPLDKPYRIPDPPEKQHQTTLIQSLGSTITYQGKFHQKKT